VISLEVEVLGCDEEIEGDKELLCSSEGMVFTTNENNPKASSYKWTIEVGGETFTETTTEPSYNWSGYENTTGVDLPLTAKVEVSYSTIPETVESNNEATATIYTTPDWQVGIDVTRNAEEQGNCDDDVNIFEILLKDETNADLVYKIGLSDPTVDAKVNFSNGVDSMHITNGNDSYTVVGSVYDATKLNSSDEFCYSRDNESVSVVVIPSLPSLTSDINRICEYTTTYEDTVPRIARYTLAEDSRFELLKWKITNENGEEINGLIDTLGAGIDALDNPYVDVYAKSVNSMNKTFNIVAEIEFTGGCDFTTSVISPLFVDTTFKVEYEIVPSDLFCEGDEGYFSVNLDSAIDDYYKKFNDYSLHMWGYNEDTIKRGNLSQTIYAGTDSSYTAYYAELYTPTDTLIEWDSLLTRKDTSWSTVVGPFNLEDSVMFVADPLFCWHKDSKLADTLYINPQEKPVVDLLFEGPDGEETDSLVLEKVVKLPEVFLFDGNNKYGTRGYSYETYFFEAGSSTTRNDGIDRPVGEEDPDTEVDLPTGSKLLYYVTELNYEVCTVLDTAIVYIDYDLFVPTGISPNDDGTNDKWVIKNIEEFPNAHVRIYNRWGSLLYESYDYINEQWDGKYEGEPLPVASYYYIIDLGDGSEMLEGAVSIFR